MMYEKNLVEVLRLRLTERDMNFLRKLSEERGSSISEVIRSIIGEYRRSLEMMEIMNQTLKMAREREAGQSNGDNETDKYNKL